VEAAGAGGTFGGTAAKAGLEADRWGVDVDGAGAIPGPEAAFGKEAAVELGLDEEMGEEATVCGVACATRGPAMLSVATWPGLRTAFA